MAEQTNLIVPELGESITEAVIGRWLKKVGESVAIDEPIVDLETDKITVQLPSPVAGALSEQRFEEGATVRVGDIVGLVHAGASVSPAAAQSEPPRETMEPPPKTSPPQEPQPVQSSQSPTVRNRALSPSQRRALRNGQTIAPPTPQIVPPEAGDTSEAEHIVPMSRMRKRIAERLVQAQHSSASLTTFNEVDMTNLMALRAKHRDAFFEVHGTKLGFMSFFVKASVAALKLFPGVNAEVRGEAIVYKKHYDLGIAVGTNKGLVVPVLRNADTLSFAAVEQGIVDLAKKARSNQLALSDLLGGTFTITNGGIYGSMMSTPLLNYPQTGILGMHNIVKRPVAIGDEVKVRPVMYVALTYDHRVVDGKEAVSFLVALKQRLEQPERLMFDL